MVKLYREHVLKEQPGPGLVQIGSIAPARRSRRSEARGEDSRRARRSRQLRRLNGAGVARVPTRQGGRLLFPEEFGVGAPDVVCIQSGGVLRFAALVHGGGDSGDRAGQAAGCFLFQRNDLDGLR